MAGRGTRSCSASTRQAAAASVTVSGTNGSTVNYTGAGNCVIDANQAGGGGYAAAAQVQQTIPVTALLTQVISFQSPASGVVGVRRPPCSENWGRVAGTRSSSPSTRPVIRGCAPPAARTGRRARSLAPTGRRQLHRRRQLCHRRQPGRRWRLRGGGAGAADNPGHRPLDPGDQLPVACEWRWPAGRARTMQATGGGAAATRSSSRSTRRVNRGVHGQRHERVDRQLPGRRELRHRREPGRRRRLRGGGAGAADDPRHRPLDPGDQLPGARERRGRRLGDLAGHWWRQPATRSSSRSTRQAAAASARSLARTGRPSTTPAPATASSTPTRPAAAATRRRRRCSRPSPSPALLTQVISFQAPRERHRRGVARSCRPRGAGGEPGRLHRRLVE